ncbi:unnamed protein product [Rhizoctonia solani]|uniref:O-methylsterigmatocystin oxidoreductase n=2 Tax=Rhizoctonia solani TaxID=456999 RepID=A0A8H3D4K9_9AGAM|nr:unnamed protein product [Rhizoctonia solani]
MATSNRLLGWGNNTGVLPYGERWRVQRRMTHELLHKRASEDLWPTIVRDSRLALQQLLENPSKFESHFRRMAGSSIIKSVYGYEATASNDALFRAVSDAVDGFAQAIVTSNFYVNIIPWMQYIPSWLPGAQWKRQAFAWRLQTEQMLNVPYDWTRDQMRTGNAPPSMMRQLLARYTEEPSEEEKDTMRWAAGTLFAAGTDTTVSNALILIAAMAMHPEIQAKAQHEVDSVLCGKRLPDMDDRQSMPYIQAIVKEELPTLVSKKTFTKGTESPREPLCKLSLFTLIVNIMLIGVSSYSQCSIANQWAMSNDEKVYTNPERFDPSRFLDPSTPEAPAFGFGRRSCPGIHMAHASLFMVVSGLAASFNIRPKCNSEGHPIPLTAEMKQNILLSQPLPFEVDIEPRSEQHERLLRAWVDI